MITYAVYNLTADYVTDVSLTTTLQAGVAFQSASAAPIQSGQQLSWNVGRLEPLEEFNVVVTVSFPGAIPLQLDNGTSAVGTMNFASDVSDISNPVTLRTDAIDPALLAATIDANSNDAFIRAKAAELNQNPNEIFNFLSNEIGYESYIGSLRGARGTLWSEAGNSLDEASLMIALLRASGVEARYVQGTLSDALSQELILSMFPDPLSVLGWIAPGVPLADPANDLQLLTETREHYWVEFDSGAGFVPADPTFVDAIVGQTFAAAQSRFAEVDDGLRHHVVVRLKRELAIPAFSAFSGTSPLTEATVLDELLTSAELVGRPLSIGHFVASQTVSAPVFKSTTHNYSPYLLLNGESPSVGSEQILRGTDYQEVLTNFTLGSQILTGLFLEVDLISPDGSTERIKKTLLDRIGFAERQGGSSTISLEPGTGPAVSEFDILTLAISSSEQSAATIAIRQAALGKLANKLEAELPFIYQINPLQQHLAVQNVTAISNAMSARETSYIAEAFLFTSDRFTQDFFAPAALTRAYSVSPRIVAISHSSDVNSSGEASNRLEFDVLRNSQRTISSPIQASVASQTTRFARGLADKLTEQVIGTEIAGPSITTSSFQTFTKALEDNIALVAIDASNLTELSSLNISEEAKSRITSSVLTGLVVLVPSEMVTIGEKVTTAWIELDPLSGDSTIVLEDGSHGFAEDIIIKYYVLLTTGGVSNVTVTGASGTAASVLYLEVKLNLKSYVLESGSRREAFLKAVTDMGIAINKANADAYFKNEVFLKFSQKANEYLATLDPPVGDLLYSLPPSQHFANLRNSTGTGVSTEIIHDPLFSVPVGGALAPTVYRIGIKNHGATTDIFAISFPDVPVGFMAESSIPQITVPSGETAELTIVLRPMAQLPNEGTIVSFSVRVTSANNPPIFTTVSESFSVPIIHGISLDAEPREVTTAPAVPVQAKLVIKAVGNVAETVNFSVHPSAGLTITGINALTLSPGETGELFVTITPSIDTPLNSNQRVTFEANFGGILPVTFTIPVRVAAAGVESVHKAAAAARGFGNVDLASRLDDLGIALTNLAQQPSNEIFKSQALESFDTIRSLIEFDPLLADFFGPMTAVQGQLSGAITDAATLAAITAIGNVLDGFSDRINILVSSNVQVFLSLNTQVAQPLTPKNFIVTLHNVGTETSTYNLAVSGLPPEVTSQLSDAQVTLDRDEFLDVTLSLTQTTDDELLAFDFSVDVSIDGVAPAITKSAIGSLRTRNEIVSVTSVIVEPAFVDPGGSANVTARVLNAVNRQRDVVASFFVKNSLGDIVFSSPDTARRCAVAGGRRFGRDRHVDAARRRIHGHGEYHRNWPANSWSQA
jgi:hypothetical protein